ncbi:putative NAD(P)H quinone oxidoreductase, PIG3 family [Chromobacterium violaceum]|uniref:Putative NAD(P)H quinone oxidoreductase, PIG3 family n=1 Tax=Chromobacterium violaceum TaxID=536 RepID=A0A447TCC5_CHRVL|nr:putative NAD(P)H quinone oxidoreductase, PIG3 family [Chromobacterium violaceum]
MGASHLAENLQALNPDGRLVNIGLMGGLKAELDFGRLLMKRISLIGSTLRPQPLAVKAELAAALRDLILPALLEGRRAPWWTAAIPGPRCGTRTLTSRTTAIWARWC